MADHWFECKLASFLAGLPSKKGQMTTQFLATVAVVLRKPMRFHLEVFDNWERGVVTAMEDYESTEYVM